jgi:hypothetical protein
MLSRHRGRLRGFHGNHQGPGRQPIDVFGGHHEQAVAGEADDLRLDRAVTGDLDQAAGAERELEARGFHHQPVDARQTARRHPGAYVGELLTAVDQEARQVRCVHVEGGEK